MPNETDTQVRPLVFVSYAHADSEWFNPGSLIDTLRKAAEVAGAELWYDTDRLQGGDLWREEIGNAIDRAHIAILLVSLDFQISNYIQHTELPLIEKRFNKRELIVIPILVGRCDYNAILSGPQIVPAKLTPLDQLRTPKEKWDEARKEIVDALRKHLRLVKQRLEEGPSPETAPPVTPPTTVDPALRRRLLLKRIAIIAVALVVAALAAVQLLKRQTPTNYGILVLRLVGDDANDSLQRKLIARLEEKLSQQPTVKNFKIRGRGSPHVDLRPGLEDAHQEARRLGEKSKTRLVVWGDIEEKIHLNLHISVVNEPNLRDLGPENVSELNLPLQPLDNLSSLAYCIFGYSLYCSFEFHAALDNFESALKVSHATPLQNASLNFLAGASCLGVAQGNKQSLIFLQKATNYFFQAEQAFRELGRGKDVAKTWNALGIAYNNWPTGDRSENLTNAIRAFEKALNGRNARGFPEEWAQSQSNLGEVLAALPTGDRKQNLLRAIVCYTNALQIRTRESNPGKWGLTVVKLGNAYLKMAEEGEERVANLQEAIRIFEDVTNTFPKSADSPDIRAWAQFGLGNAYAALPSGDQAENIRTAIDFYQKALDVFTRDAYGERWAMIKNSLGVAYVDLATKDKTVDFQTSFKLFEEALSIFTPDTFPEQWADTQSNLGDAYFKAPENKPENLQKAINFYRAALTVFTERSYPAKNKEISEKLRSLEKKD